MKKITYRKKDRENSHDSPLPPTILSPKFHILSPYIFTLVIPLPKIMSEHVDSSNVRNSKVNDNSRNHFKYPNQKQHVFLFRLCIDSKSVIRIML